MRRSAALAILSLPIGAAAQPGEAVTVRVAAGASACHAAAGVELCRTREPVSGRLASGDSVPGNAARAQVRWTLRVDGQAWTRHMPDGLADDAPEETWTLARRDDDGDGTPEAVVTRTPVWEPAAQLHAPTTVWRWSPSWPDVLRYQTSLDGDGEHDLEHGRLTVYDWQFDADPAARPRLVARRYRLRPGRLDPTGEVATRPFTAADDRQRLRGAARWDALAWARGAAPVAVDPLRRQVRVTRTRALRLDTLATDPAAALGDLALGTRSPLPADLASSGTATRAGTRAWFYLTDAGSAQDLGYIGRVGVERAGGRVAYWPAGYRPADVRAWLVGRPLRIADTAWRDAADTDQIDAIPTLLLHLTASR